VWLAIFNCTFWVVLELCSYCLNIGITSYGSWPRWKNTECLKSIILRPCKQQYQWRHFELFWFTVGSLWVGHFSEYLELCRHHLGWSPRDSAFTRWEMFWFEVSISLNSRGIFVYVCVWELIQYNILLLWL